MEDEDVFSPDSDAELDENFDVETEPFEEGIEVEPSEEGADSLPLEAAAAPPPLTQQESDYLLAAQSQNPESVSDLPPEYVDNFAQEMESYEKYGNRPVAAATMATLDSASFSLASRIAKATGAVSQETLKGLRDENQAADVVGNILGIVVPAVLTGGTSAAAKAVSTPVGMAMKAGAATERAVAKGLEKAIASSGSKKIAQDIVKKSLAANLTAKAAGGAVEGAIFGAGAALREDALGSPESLGENLIAHAGTGALYGGIMSAALPAVGSAIGKTAKGGKSLFDKAVTRYANPQEAALEYVGATPAQRVRLNSHSSGQEILENLPKILVEDGKITATASIREVLENLEAAKSSANTKIDTTIAAIDEMMETGDPAMFKQAQQAFLPIAQKINKDFIAHYADKGPAFSPIVNKSKKIVNSLKIMAGQPEFVSVQKLTNRVKGLTDEIRTLKNTIRKENAAANRAAHEAGYSKIAKLSDELALTEKQLDEHVLARTKRNTDAGTRWDAESAIDSQTRTALEARAAKLKSAIETESANFHAPVDAKTFFKKIQEVVKNPNPMFKANITPYSEDAYKGFRTFLSADGKSGYAVKPDGELISVFSLVKGRGERLVDDAIRNKGATKLDAFDINGKLPELYGKYMKVNSRLKFADEYAPEGWDYSKLGRPDVVTMSIDPATAKGLKRAATANEARLAQLEADLYQTSQRHGTLLKDKKWARKVKASELRELKQDFDELAKSFYDNMKPSEASKAAYSVRKMMNDTLRDLAERVNPKLAAELEEATKKSHQLIEVTELMAKKAERPDLTATTEDLILGFAGSAFLGPQGLAIVGGKKFLESDLKRKMVILTGIEKANKKIGAKIAESTADFFKASATPSRLAASYSLMASSLAVNRQDNSKPKNEQEAFQNISNNLVNLATNTDELLQRTIKAGAPLSVAAPETAQVVGEKLATMTLFLHEKLPKRPNDTVSIFKSSRPFTPSSIELAKFNRYLQAVENPLSVFDELAHGSITREHIEALNAVYPDMSMRLKQQVLEHVRNSDEGSVSYQKRLQLGALLDIPTDDSLMGVNIQALQENFDPQLQSQEGAAPGAPSKEETLKGEELNMAERAASGAQSFEQRREQ